MKYIPPEYKLKLETFFTIKWHNYYTQNKNNILGYHLFLL